MKKPKKERESCHVSDGCCEAPAGYKTYDRSARVNDDLPVRLPKCFRCELPVCKACSSRRKWGAYGRKRLCNSCQVILDGNDKIVMQRMHRLTRGH